MSKGMDQVALPQDIPICLFTVISETWLNSTSAFVASSLLNNQQRTFLNASGAG